MATETNLTGNIASFLKEKNTPYKADFSKYLVHNDVRRALESFNWEPLVATELVENVRDPDTGLPKRKPPKKIKTDEEEAKQVASLSVGIIGAGIAGLYTALICQYLGVQWHIIEANPERVGGRLYTKYLSKENKLHDYYDIGAMRYPCTPIMERTFTLLARTSTKIGPYYMASQGTSAPIRYNDITHFPPKTSDKVQAIQALAENEELPVDKDTFKVSKTNGGPVPDHAVADPDLIMAGAYNRFRERIKRAYKKIDGKFVPGEQNAAWEYLLKHDRFSLRDYLTFVEGEDFEATHWLETLNAGTGWFDQAFSEHVLESLAFDFYEKNETPWGDFLKGEQTDDEAAANKFLRKLIAAPDTQAEYGKWYFIQNGSSSLAMNTLRSIDCMITGKPAIDKEFPKLELGDFEKVMEKVSLGKRVVKIGADYATEKPLKVYVVDSKNDFQTMQTKLDPKPDFEFDIVLNSTTLGAMQKMDLLELNLPYDTKAAIRMLRYDTSTKVAIRFKTQWWNQPGMNLQIQGGIGKTDLPLRTCVYPSYNVNDPAKDDEGKDNTFILLCSYTWGADSERIAAMIQGLERRTLEDGKKDELATVMLDNLARLHTKSEAEYQTLRAQIDGEFIRYHAYDWSNDPYTCGGAFGLFSAHQFSKLYPALVKPLADARLHVVGEAASAHHAWVAGALDSVVRGLYNAFTRFDLPTTRGKMEKEFGECGEIDRVTDYLQVAMSMATKKSPLAAKITAATAA